MMAEILILIPWRLSEQTEAEWPGLYQQVWRVSGLWRGRQGGRADCPPVSWWQSLLELAPPPPPPPPRPLPPRGRPGRTPSLAGEECWPGWRWGEWGGETEGNIPGSEASRTSEARGSRSRPAGPGTCSPARAGEHPGQFWEGRRRGRERGRDTWPQAQSGSGRTPGSLSGTSAAERYQWGKYF